MPSPSPTHATATPHDRSLRPVLLLVLGVLAARVLYLVCFCRYDLVEDEAHYWLWSRHLDWSYYSKGPGVAWAIRAATAIFGEAEWAVRLPTAISAAIGALAIGALARDMAAESGGGVSEATPAASPARVGFLAALAYTLVPAFQGTAILMTIDGPYIACWAVACWAFWKAHTTPRAGAFLLVFGAAVALGFLFKYTILLLLPGLLLFGLVARRRGLAFPGAARPSPPFIVGAVLLILAGLAPVLYWNAQHHWPTLRHLLGHLGVAGGDMPVPSRTNPSSRDTWSPWWLPELVGQQFGLIGPWIILGFLSFWRAAPTPDPRRTAREFLFCVAAPILVFYAIVSLIAEPEGNWPMGAFVTLLPLAAWIAADALAQRAAFHRAGTPVPGPIKLRVRLWRVGLTYALIAAVFIHALTLIGDAALALDKVPVFHNSYHRLLGRDPARPESVVRDPAGRLRGARVMAEHVADLLTSLRDGTQREPFVIAQHYGRASQLAYYLHRTSRPWTEVLCAMAHTGGRESQFDYWPETGLRRPELRDRPAVIITSVQPYMVDVWRTFFAEVRPIPDGRLRGESKPDRSALLGFSYKGPPDNPIPAPQAPTPVPAHP